MSEKLPQGPESEEVDLGQLFNAIGKLFEKLFRFIGNIFKGIFSGIIYALKPIVEHFKLVAAVIVLAAILGFISDKSLRKPKYHSSMLVKPYFESKYELVNSIGYFNSLIASKNTKELSNIFEIDTLEAKSLVGFEIESGPETQDDLLKQYDDYVNSIEVDSTMLTYLPYDVYVKNRDLISSEIFSINAISFVNNVFPNLEKGIIKVLKNSHSISLKEKSDEVYGVQKRSYEKQLARIDSLQRLYIEVRRKESENNKVGFSGSMFPLAEDKSETKEFELFREEVKIRNLLRRLEQEKIEEQNEYYEIISNFDAIGAKGGILNRHFFFFPVFAFLSLASIYIAISVFKYIRNYE